MVDAGASRPRPLPVWLATGFRRTARARLIEALLAERPDGQVWAIAASGLPLPIAAHPSILAATLPAGCPCCTGTTAFQVGMTRLLRALRGTPVERLVVEIAEAAHVARARLAIVHGARGSQVRLDATIAVVEAAELASGAPRAARATAELAPAVDLVVVAPPADEAARAFAAAHAHVRVAEAWSQVGALTDGLGASRLS